MPITRVVKKVAGGIYPRAFKEPECKIPHPWHAPPFKFRDIECNHAELELYVRPCLKCNKFCNCNYTYFPKKYPDVVVRSVDKHLVQLSGDTVRASVTLRSMVDRYVKAKEPTPLHEDSVIIKREQNSMNCVTEYKILASNGLTVKSFAMEKSVSVQPGIQKEGESKTGKDNGPVKDTKEKEPGEGLSVIREDSEPKTVKNNGLTNEIKKREAVAYPVDFKIRNTARKWHQHQESMKKIAAAAEAKVTPKDPPIIGWELCKRVENNDLVNDNKENEPVAGPSITRKENEPKTDNGLVNGPKKGKVVAYPSDIRILDTARNWHKYKQEKKDAEMPAEKWEDLIEIDPNRKTVLALFDVDSDQPTLGITKDMLIKCDYFMAMHLDEVDRKVAARKRYEVFRWITPYQSDYGAYMDEELDLRDVNPFLYEDWEEDFFNVDPGTFFDIHKANQQLIIYDLYLAIEKWMYFARGMPKAMNNGFYDPEEDPEYDGSDANAPFVFSATGYPSKYPIKYRESVHIKKTPRYSIKMYAPTYFTPRWFHIHGREKGVEGKNIHTIKTPTNHVLQCFLPVEKSNLTGVVYKG